VTGLGLLLFEFAIVAGLFVADVYHHIFFSKTRICSCWDGRLCAARHEFGKMLGSPGPRVGGKAFGVGITVGVAMELSELFISQPLLASGSGRCPTYRISRTSLDLKLLLVYLALVWVLGALGEELVYRGYLMNRAAGLFRESKSGLDCKLGRGQRCWLRAPRPGQHWHGGEYFERTLTRWVCIWCAGRNLVVPVIAQCILDTP